MKQSYVSAAENARGGSCTKRRDFLEKWGLSTLKIKLGFLEGEFVPRDPDRAAAWELYVELMTRSTTQFLAPEAGDEEAALESVYALFPLTRDHFVGRRKAPRQPETLLARARGLLLFKWSNELTPWRKGTR